MWITIGLPASLIMVVVGCHFGYILCHDHPAAFLMGLLLGRWTFLGFKDFQALADEQIDSPEPKSYDLSELEAMAVIRETLTYTSLGDKWWHIRDLNLDDGRILASVSLEEESGRYSDIHFSRERIISRTQVVLIAEVAPRSMGVLKVRYRFVVSAQMGRHAGTEVVKSMTAALDEALDKRVKSKKPATEPGVAV
jgi:hypothetical protein